MSSSSSSSSSPSSSSPTAHLRLVHLPGRGRSYVSTRTILPGEILLSDLPILLYPPSPSTRHCSHCFRTLPSSTPYKCPSCSSPFCSHSCLSSSSHNPSPSPSFLCRSLSLLLPSSPHLLSQELLFLLSAFSLHPSLFSLLLSLHPSPSPPSCDVSSLHSLLSSLGGPPPPPPPFSFHPDLTAALLAVDRANAFGLMDGRGSVRAYGIYPHASSFNHDCLPNACRFEYVDAGPPERNAEMFVRAIHEIPEGREVCLSYFPVNWGFKERQRRLWEEYGFQCTCDRCEVEKNWKEEEEEEEEEEEGDGEEGMEEEGDGEEGMEEDDFPHAYFFVKFQCRQEGCGGTLAPLPPSLEGMVSDRMECNACGCVAKSEEEEGDEEENSAMVDG